MRLKKWYSFYSLVCNLCRKFIAYYVIFIVAVEKKEVGIWLLIIHLPFFKQSLPKSLFCYLFCVFYTTFRVYRVYSLFLLFFPQRAILSFFLHFSHLPRPLPSILGI